MTDYANPSRRRWLSKRKICVALTLLALVAALLGYRSWSRSEMLRVTLDWGRLAPLLASKQDFTITTAGGMFTRAFRASFSASMADVERWLHDSPGTRDVAPERPSPTSRKYLIVPSGGAAHAEVTVEESSGAVGIYVYWS
jgi:hypothetical protein